MEIKDDIYESLVSEFRRGFIVLGVLSQLEQPEYGYSLNTLLEEKGLRIDPGTLYPLLRRLEKQGLLASSWDTDTNKPRKYYSMTDYGKKTYKRLVEEWAAMSELMGTLIQGGRK